MKKVVSIVVCMLILVTLCACGGGNDSVASTQWQLTGVDLGGIKVTGADQLAEYGIEGSVIFSADQFMLTLSGDQIGTYTQKADIITLTGPDGKVMFGVVDGDTLTIEDEDVGTLYFTKG